MRYRLVDLKGSYEYAGADTCAADGMCQVGLCLMSSRFPTHDCIRRAQHHIPTLGVVLSVLP